MPRPKRTPYKPPKVKWMTATEAAAEIGKSIEWLRKMRIKGEVYCELLDNGRWGFPEFEVERLKLRTPRKIYEQQNLRAQ